MERAAYRRWLPSSQRNRGGPVSPFRGRLGGRVRKAAPVGRRRRIGKLRLEAARADDAPEEPEAEEAGDDEADHREDMEAEDLRPALGEDPEHARADQAGGDDERDHEPVERDVQLAHELVQTLVDEADLDLAVADLLQRVVKLIRELPRDAREVDRLAPCA